VVTPSEARDRPEPGEARDGRPRHAPRSPDVAEGRRELALDGIRGLAVVAVVVYHLGFGWAKGGYLGVDTFLVLSGYLITAGLVREHARSGGIRFRAFWGRRIRRLVPALLVVLLAAAAYAATVALPDGARSLRLDGLSALAFVANWRFIVTSQGYFGQTAAPSLLRHTWSLGVEFQLYLLWPFVVAAVLARGGRRLLSGVALTMAAASAAAAMVLAHPGADVTRAYYGTDTRAAAFLVGAAVAAGVVGRPRTERPRGGWLLALAGAAGAAVTAALWVTLSGSSTFLFRGGLPLAAVATAAMVLDVVVRPAGLAARALSFRPLRLLGAVSYGIYLWHWPLFLVLNGSRTGLSGAALAGVRLGATALATALSWVAVERPVLHKGPRALPRRWHPVLAGVLTIAVAACLVVPLARRQPRPIALELARPTTTVAQPPSGPVPTTVPPPPVPAVMLGDSVAVTLGNGLVPLSAAYGVTLRNGAIVGCGVALGTSLRTQGQQAVIPGRCQGWEQEWQTWERDVHPEATVILLGRWEMLDRVVDGRWQHIGQPSFDAYLAGQLDRALTITQSGGGVVVLCTAPYYPGLERPQGGTWPENDPARVDRFNQLLREAAGRHPGVILFDLNALVSPVGHFASVIDGVAVRSSDGIHFSPEGAAFVAPRLLPEIVAAVRRPETPGVGSGAR